MAIANFLFEIGTEELPHNYVDEARVALIDVVKTKLQELQLSYTSFKGYSTPRRLALIIENLQTKQKSRQHLKRGPLLSMVFKDGQITPAGKGFMNFVGITALPDLKDIPSNEVKEGLFKKKEKGKVFLYHSTWVTGQSTKTLLTENLPIILKTLPFPKSMRWSDLHVAFYRPIKWLVCLLGDEIIPLSLAGIVAEKFSQGHRQFSSEKKISVNANNYLKILKDNGVVVDHNERKNLILQQLEKIEQKLGCMAISKEKVLSEVNNLVEWPHLICCEFQKDFLKIPQEVLISEMVKHQMYFPLIHTHSSKNDSLSIDSSLNSDEKPLANLFVVISNIEKENNVKKGNLKVLTSRFRDGAFLYKEDLDLGLTAMGEKLIKVTYQKDLGSYADKIKRMEKLSTFLSRTRTKSVKEDTLKAITLCKNDLTSNMVGEFPHLQGIMGEYYSKAEGHSKRVSRAIRDHYLPTSSGGNLPQDEVGVLIALADKWDTILGCFAVRLFPTKSNDPYALRRQAFGIIRIVIEKKLFLSLKEMLAFAIPEYRYFVVNHFSEEIGGKRNGNIEKSYQEKILQFFVHRLKSFLKEKKIDPDVIEASVSEDIDDVYLTYLTAEAIIELKEKPLFKNFIRVFKRVKNILKKEKIENISKSEDSSDLAVSPDLFEIEEEKKLFAFYQNKKKGIEKKLANRQFVSAFTDFAEFNDVLAVFFDNVLVNVEDKKIKNNRLKLLISIDYLMKNVLDFSKLIV